MTYALTVFKKDCGFIMIIVVSETYTVVFSMHIYINDSVILMDFTSRVQHIYVDFKSYAKPLTVYLL